jgi:hypothetical protein
MTQLLRQLDWALSKFFLMNFAKQVGISIALILSFVDC